MELTWDESWGWREREWRGEGGGRKGRGGRGGERRGEERGEGEERGGTMAHLAVSVLTCVRGASLISDVGVV